MKKTPFWYHEEFDEKMRIGLMVDEVLFEGQSDFQKVEIFKTRGFGRVLAIDNMFMTSERDEHYYHEMLVHPAMTTAPRIARVLIIGGGDGGSAREALTYDEVEHVHMVEIDGIVVEASKKYLKTIGTAWDDPRLKVEIGDGVAFAKTAEVEPYDVIFLDGCDPVGPAEGLFTEEFYRGIKRLLAKDGIFALQSESPVTMPDIFGAIRDTLKTIFNEVHPYFGPVPIYASGDWSWTYATQSVDQFAFNEKRMTHQEARCKYYNREIHRGAFAIPNNIKKLSKYPL